MNHPLYQRPLPEIKAHEIARMLRNNSSSSRVSLIRCPNTRGIPLFYVKEEKGGKTGSRTSPACTLSCDITTFHGDRI